MEYDHLIIPGFNHRLSKEEILADVRKQADEWYENELKLRLDKGGERREIVSKLDDDTKKWIELEFQRRMNWNYEEESTEPLE